MKRNNQTGECLGWCLGLVLLLLGGCSSTPAEPEKDSATMAASSDAKPEPGTDVGSEARDPIEPVNRAIWSFNYQVMDRYIYRPVTRAYINYVPDPAKEGVNNMVRNLDEPSSTVNHLLMGEGVKSGKSLVRFMVNSTVGVLGFFDVADLLGVAREQAEFGDVLAKAGAGEGAYLMIPAAGPSTLLNEAGDFVDHAYFPYSQLTLPITLVRLVADGLYKRASVADQEPLLDSALDPYLFVRDSYLQYRDASVGRQRPQQDNQDEIHLEEYLDELD